MDKAVRKGRLGEFSESAENLRYWLSRSPAERVEAVESLGRQHYGNALRLQGTPNNSFSTANGPFPRGSFRASLDVSYGYACVYANRPHRKIPRSRDEKQLLEAPLREFGFGDAGLSADDFCKADQVVQLGYPPVRIDLLTSLSGVDWEEAARYAVAGHFMRQPVPYLGREQLIKKQTGDRPPPGPGRYRGAGTGGGQGAEERTRMSRIRKCCRTD